jgi:hypothetical protein
MNARPEENMSKRNKTNKFFQIFDNPIVVAIFFVPYVVVIRFYIFPKYAFLLEPDMVLLQNFIEWFGIAYGLLLALVLVNVWSQFDLLEKDFDSEAAAVSALYQTVSFIKSMNPMQGRIIKYIQSYIRHVLDNYAIEHKNVKARANGKEILDQIGQAILVTLRGEEMNMLSGEIIKKWNDIKDFREDRISRSRQRIPNGVWMLAILSSILWLIPFYGLDFRNDLIAIFLTGGVTFVVITMLVVIKDLDDPFDGTWTISLDEWEFIEEEMGLKPSIVLVYSLDNTIAQKFLERLGRLISVRLDPLYALVHTSSRQSQTFFDNLSNIANVEVLYRDEYVNKYGEEVNLPLIFHQVGSNIRILVNAEEISEFVSPSNLEKALTGKLGVLKSEG